MGHQRSTKAYPTRLSNPNLHHRGSPSKKQSDNDCNGLQRVQKIQQAAESHWGSFPKEARTFIVSSPLAVNFHSLAKFWSTKNVIEYKWGTFTMWELSLFMALSYMKLGRLDLARALTLNGAFLLQCVSTSIESIVGLCGPQFNTPINNYKVAIPLFGAGFHSVESTQKMEAYLEDKLRAGYDQMLESFIKTQAHDIMGYVDEIGDEWTGTPAKKHPKSSSNSNDDTKIQLVLVDSANEDAVHCLDIGSSTTLKTLFNDYAEKRGVSLRSLRFSYCGQTLFLSSVGNKTPEECNMRDQDVITVHDTSASQEPITSKEGESQKKAKSSKYTSKKTKGKGKRNKKKQAKQEQPAEKPIEECKLEHSAVLSQLHEEVEPKLKEIRMKLNSLDLERQPPKQKKRKKKKNSKDNVHPQAVLPDSSCTGGKAGKPYYVVQVGEVQNLYKTTKPSQSSQTSSCNSSDTMLDLHGCTKEEALQILDKTLPMWVDSAMRGSYPFVIPATIVCGCGSQVLSETVERWIKDNARVANAPKNSVQRQ